MRTLSYSLLFAYGLLVTCSSALTLDSKRRTRINPVHSDIPSTTTSRRSWLATAGLLATGSILSSPESVSAAGNPSAFVATYSDPINHPGGRRTIRLLEGKTVGEYQLAEVEGGGGIGEPANYVLPAVIVGDRSIIIDFSPKGGPRDFLGVLDGGDIKFLKDGNRWPRIK